MPSDGRVRLNRSDNELLLFEFLREQAASGIRAHKHTHTYTHTHARALLWTINDFWRQPHSA